MAGDDVSKYPAFFRKANLCGRRDRRPKKQARKKGKGTGKNQWQMIPNGGDDCDEKDKKSNGTY